MTANLTTDYADRKVIVPTVLGDMTFGFSDVLAADADVNGSAVARVRANLSPETIAKMAEAVARDDREQTVARTLAKRDGTPTPTTAHYDAADRFLSLAEPFAAHAAVILAGTGRKSLPLANGARIIFE